MHARYSCVLAVSLVAVFLIAAAVAQTPATARLIEGIGDVHHTVSTRNAEAQRYFDQGLALIYGFNHNEAARSFHRAAELDPNLAMAWWGVALAVGPNYNLPVDQQRELEAYDAVQKALKLASSASAGEHAYIEALAKRYTNQPTSDYMKLERAYQDSMREVVRRFPDDLDAATLFAESGMNQRPWKLWNKDGTPAPGTEEIVITLESVLKRDPNHLGANHYYIHAVEASPHPERALASAYRLASLAPAEGHLVHMPAHIYIRTGDHSASERTNQMAAKADEAYIAEAQPQGIYPMMYYTHNLHFIAVENAIMGRYDDAMNATRRIEAHVGPHLHAMPMLDGFNAVRPQLLTGMARWDEILAAPQPDSSLPMTSGMWHYARGMAFATRGQIQQAQAELAALEKLTPEMAKIPTNPQGPRNAGIMPQIASRLIQARMARARKQPDGEMAHLRAAVTLQDSMDYTEPPDWIFPVRDELGTVLLTSGNAAAAEKIFREDLDWNPRNPRSLFGLMEALKAQDRADDARAVEQQFRTVWKGEDMPLVLARR